MTTTLSRAPRKTTADPTASPIDIAHDYISMALRPTGQMPGERKFLMHAARAVLEEAKRNPTSVESKDAQ